MKLIIAKSAGFCFGVKRAIDMALDAVKKYPKDLHTLGPLIHNPQAVEFLKEFGVKARDRIEHIPGGTVIFRSHGVSPKDLMKAREKKLRIIDATCPIVKRAQLHAKYLHQHGYALLIVGEAQHPEVDAIRSYIQDGVNVVEGVKELRVFNTICHATTIRQMEAVEIARKVDCVIVIGGHNSGNTQRLAAICRDIQLHTYHIETAEELHPKWLAKRERIGVTAGASTPSWIIKEVENEVRHLKGLRG